AAGEIFCALCAQGAASNNRVEFRYQREGVARMPIRDPTAPGYRRIKAPHKLFNPLAGFEAGSNLSGFARGIWRPLLDESGKAFGTIGRGVIAQNRIALESEAVLERCAYRDRNARFRGAYGKGCTACDYFRDLAGAADCILHLANFDGIANAKRG